METTSWSLPAAFEVVAAAAPDRDMLVWKQARRTYAEVERRTRNLAAFLRRHGIGLRRERHELERWECGQATGALGRRARAGCDGKSGGLSDETSGDPM